MLLNLNELGDPIDFWEYFERISKIPRCSGKEEEIRNFIKNEAINFEFTTKVDQIGNLFVEIPKEKANNKQKRICLQCHLDMVCEKNKTFQHDFLHDPLKLKLITKNNEKWLTAEGTTLGADNGVGIAYCLAIMKKIYKKEIQFDNILLSFLFTVDEESGLLGAFSIDTNLLKCDYLLNLDSGHDEKITIGCAGGINTYGKLEFESEKINKYADDLIAYKLSISGLKGGHSGVDIHKGRINAIKLINTILSKSDSSKMFLHSLSGGNRTNAIPREVNAILFLEKKIEKDFIASLEHIILTYKLSLKEIEPNIHINLVAIDKFKDNLIVPNLIKNKLLNLISNLPNGPIKMHDQISNLVHTSINLASINVNHSLLEIKTSQRSLEEISKQEICDIIKNELFSTDLNFQIQNEGNYPCWSPNLNSKLLLIARQKFKELFNKDVIIKVIHAGLECGILKTHFPDMELISFGPNIKGAHSPDEKLHINSVKKIWDFLIKIMKEI